MIVMNPCVHDSRVIKEAESLAGAGYCIRVVCLMHEGVPQQEFINGVEYYRVYYRIPFNLKYKKIKFNAADNTQKTTSLFRKIYLKLMGILYYFAKKLIPFIKYHLTYFSVKNAILSFSPDSIHAHDLVTLPTAVTIGKKLNIPVVYDAHELEEHRMPVQNFIIRSLVVYLERKYIPYTSGTITVSNSIAQYLANKYKINEPIVVYNSPDIYPDDKPITDVKTELNLPHDIPLIVYVGRAQASRGVEELLQAMQYLPNYHLVFVGPKVDRFHSKFIQIVEDLKVSDRISFLPPVSIRHVVPYISTADLGVYFLQNTCLNHYYAMPNKIFEMVLAGLPVVGPDLFDIKQFLDKTKTGIIVDQTKPELIAEAISEAFAKKDILKPSPEALGRLIEQYGWGAQAKKILQLYVKIYAVNK